MTIERRNPLPVGTYWIDIIDKRGRFFEPVWRVDQPTTKFDGWIDAGVADGSIVLDASTKFGGVTRGDFSGESGKWYKFRVLKPIAFPRDKRWGFPTVVRSATAPNAPPVETHADTSRRPKPTSKSLLADWLGDAKSLAVAAVALYLLTRDKR